MNTQSATCDVLVIGSGAAGMSAAVTARHAGLDVVLMEKSALIGGTTALSGGFLWIPCNPVSEAAGARDSVDAARTYIQTEAGNHFDGERVDAFLAAGPEMIRFFEAKTVVKFDPSPHFADYHPDLPGAVSGGRSILARPFDGRLLGNNLAMLRPPLRELTFLGLTLGSGSDVRHFTNASRSARSAAFVAGRMVRHARDLALHRRSMRLLNGNALAARLLRSALDLGVRIMTGTTARALLSRAGRVTGVEAEREGVAIEVRASRAVILASGGFPHDEKLRHQLYPHVGQGISHHSLAPLENCGDGLAMARAVGAAWRSSLSNPAAWTPVSEVHRRDGSIGLYPHFIDRGKPGIIAVMSDGRRFTNESASYHDFIQGYLAAVTSRGVTDAFFIADHRALRRYGLGIVKPFPVPLGAYLRSGYLKRGSTLADLARVVGIDADALTDQVERFNRAAARGEDPEFRKGSSTYNRFQGDPDHQPNPCLAPLSKPPFYAVRIKPGDIGTFAGIETDARTRVLDEQGEVIPGLCAVGNDASSVMGGSYPGGGITLGPAMTFGYIAARQISENTAGD
ncbi:MAG: FAD-dependent oxidoreductase [Azospirillaceae bacterium]